jgi:hypothetical protein
MLGEIATAAGYVKAPRATFVVKHPVRAMRMARVRRDIRENLTRTRIALGLGILAAIPLGIWLGRRIIESRREEELAGTVA